MKSDFSKVTSRGRLVIPARLRKKHGIRAGTKVAFFEEGSRIVLQPITRRFIESLQGFLPKSSKAIEILIRERRQEREP